MNKSAYGCLAEASAGCGLDPGRGTVCVGDALRESACPDFLQYRMGTEVVDYCELAARARTGDFPDLIISALVSAHFDCVDIALLLQGTGFDGRYRVIARGLPNPELVRREIKAACPSLDVELLVDPPGELLRMS